MIVVLSGVPQSTVSVTMCTIISFKDLNENALNSDISSCADYTKLSGLVRSPTDQQIVQFSHEIVFEWSDCKNSGKIDIRYLEMHKFLSG